MKKNLKSLRKNKPKEYWKILNSCKDTNNKSEVSLESLYTYFKNINTLDIDSTEQDNQDGHVTQTDDDDILNSEITKEEIRLAISNLKNGKASGYDEILNEHIKVTENILTSVYHKLFNLILITGIIPNIWLKGTIVPIYKSGDVLNPENYRPITLLSCIGKVFTAVLNKRLSDYVNHYEILCENQTGFRKGYSTTENIFVLQSLIDLLRARKRKLYCAFIDFSKAFDRVWRPGLWQKLIKNDIKGNFLRVIQNMYKNIQSCIKLKGEYSPFFPCETGVRQGENLSPLLFSLFLNDLESYLSNKGCKGVDFSNEDLIDVVVKILVLLYADDTILISDNPDDLQKNLNAFSNYCNEWKLKVNIQKTKIVIFGSRGCRGPKFKYNDIEIEIVEQYKYLGIIFKQNGNFNAALLHLSTQAKKAMHLLYVRIQNLCLPVDCQLLLFDQTIAPILQYGCEIWGFSSLAIIEKIYTEFLRYILKLKKSTPLVMLHGETGTVPLSLSVKIRTVCFWSKLISGSPNKLSSLTYRLLLNDFQLFQIKHKWICFVKNILDQCGLSYIWTTQNIPDYLWLKNNVKLILHDQYKQFWSNYISCSTKCNSYALFKTQLVLEPYLSILPVHFRSCLLKFRTTNHRFPIETGRWQKIDRQERKCTLCTKNDIGDEFHYLFIYN